MRKSKKKEQHQTTEVPLLILCVTALFCLGVIMLYSTTVASHGYSLLFKQSLYIMIGITVATLLSKIDYHVLEKLATPLVWLVIGGLSYLYIAMLLHNHNIMQLPFAKATKGAYRWIRLWIFSIQVSEFGKVAIIIYLSKMFAKNQVYYNIYFQKWRTTRANYWKSTKILITKIGLPFLFVGVLIGLIFLGKNLSVTIVSGMIVTVMALVAGIKIRIFVPLVILVVAVFVIDHYVLKTNVILSEYRMKRITSFREPEKQKRADGMQLWRSQLALGSGGLTGKGLTNGVMKNRIPEAHTDFILAIVGEELGYVILMLVLGLYIVITICGFRIAGQAPDQLGAFLAIGFSVSILFHAFVNFSVMCGLFPTTGLTAPFVSYGGSSLIANLIGIGVILSVAKQSKKQRR